MARLRKVPLEAVTSGDPKEIAKLMRRPCGYLDNSVTVLDCAGRDHDRNEIMPNGMILIDNAYCYTWLYVLGDGEVVEIDHDSFEID